MCSPSSPNAGQPCNSDALCLGGECGPALFDVRPFAAGGVGPVAIQRAATAGICQQSVLPPNAEAMCTPTSSCSGNGPCVQYALTAGSPVPLVSAINYGAGQTRANNAIAPLSADGRLAVRCVQATGGVHVILDVNGYFE